MHSVRVVGAMDILEQHAREVAEEYGIPLWTTDMDELLAVEDISAVVVATPTYAHAGPTIQAARAGKHIFCEKPIALTVEQADDMISTCERARVKLMIGLVRRFDNQWLRLRELIQDGLIGRPVIWRSSMAVGKGGGYGASWRMQKGQGEGIFVELGVHHFDFALFTFGEPKWVFASTRTWQPEATAIDTGTALVRFCADDELLLSWCRGLPPGCRAGHLHDVLGPKRSIVFPMDDFQQLSMEDRPVLIVKEPGGREKLYPYERNDMYADELKHFIQCVADDLQPRVDGKEGKRALEVALAVSKAGETGEVIRF
jgi:predicted dehydrogenase